MNKEYTKQELIEVLQKFTEENGKRPKRYQVDKEVVKACDEHFGSWKKALKETGLMSRKYSREEVLEEVKRKSEELKRSPLKSELDSNLQIFINKYFDGYNDLLNELDLQTNINFYTFEYLRTKIHEWVKEHGRAPLAKELGEIEGLPDDTYFCKIVDVPYLDFLKEIGLEEYYNLGVKESKEELLNMYIEFSKKLGRPATYQDLDSSDETYNASVFTTRFGGMKELKEAAGFTKDLLEGNRKYSKKILKKLLTDEYVKNKNKRLTKSQLVNSDLPAMRTIIKYFKTTRMSDVWEEIENEMKSE